MTVDWGSLTGYRPFPWCEGSRVAFLQRLLGSVAIGGYMATAFVGGEAVLGHFA